MIDPNTRTRIHRQCGSGFHIAATLAHGLKGPIYNKLRSRSEGLGTPPHQQARTIALCWLRIIEQPDGAALPGRGKTHA